MTRRATYGLLGLILGITLAGRNALAQPTISLTFDDGLLSHTTAQAILDAHGMKGTFYIISGLIGTDPGYYLGLAPIQAIQADGHEIGGHTVTHPDLITLTTAQQQIEICNGRAQLITMGFNPISLAYPYGDANLASETIAQGCGYTSARGAWNQDPVTNGPASDVEPLPPAGPLDKYWIRTPEAIQNTTTLAMLESYVNEAETYPGGNGWVSLQFHFICADNDPTCGNGGGTPEQYGIGVSTFTAFITWLQGQVGANAVVVRTVGQVMGGLPVNPLPILSSINPSSATVGSAAFTMTVNGFNFTNSTFSVSTVLWNGAARPTTFVNSTQITAQIPATDLVVAGTATITVSNSGPGGGVSGSLPFIIKNPIPALTSISPAFTSVGGPTFVLTATGTNFVSSSTIRWNGAARPTTFVNSTTITAQIPTTDITTVKIDTITVFNPGPGGGTSAGKTIQVQYPLPVLTSLSPATAFIGGPAFTLTATGSGFVSSSTIHWNGTTLPTTYVNGTTLTTTIPASNLTTLQVSTVTVVNPAPGGGTSTVVFFTVGNPVPVLNSLSPSTTTVGSPSALVTLTGSNFVSGSVIQWNGSPRTTTFINSTTLTTTLGAADLATAGGVNITVFNPPLLGGTSAPQVFTVANPVPVLSSLSPVSVIVGGPATTLTVTGSNFIGGSVIQWNGSPRTTAFVNSTTLTTLLSVSDVAAATAVNVTVFNPAPIGGTSATQVFTVGNPTPILNTLVPSSVTVGSSSFTLTAKGANFITGSVIQWNGAPRTTFFVDSTTLSTFISSGDVTVSTYVNVTVFNPAPQGGTSAITIFTVGYPAPLLTHLSPSFRTAGTGGFTLTVTGSNFIGTSVVQWNGSSRPTVVVDSHTLTADISAADVAVANEAQVTVFTPGPGGGTSIAQVISITAAEGTGASATDSVRVFPNPWRANLHATHPVTFDQLPTGSTIKIFTTSAHWVKTLDAPAGSATWDLKNDSGDNVASGYYVYLITGPNVHDKTRGVLGIIR